MSFVNFMGLVVCLTGIIAHVIFKFTKTAAELERSGPNTPSNHSTNTNIQLKETTIDTGDSQPLLYDDEA